jgi:hypothetical protein
MQAYLQAKIKDIFDSSVWLIPSPRLRIYSMNDYSIACMHSNDYGISCAEASLLLACKQGCNSCWISCWLKHTTEQDRRRIQILPTNSKSFFKRLQVRNQERWCLLMQEIGDKKSRDTVPSKWSCGSWYFRHDIDQDLTLCKIFDLLSKNNSTSTQA